MMAEGIGDMIVLSLGVIDVKVLFCKNFYPLLLPHVEIRLSKNPLEACVIRAKGKLLAQ